MDFFLADARRFVHNQEHVSARFLRELKGETSLDEETLAAGICGVISVYLLVGEESEVLANFLLTMIPLFWTYVFVNERPSIDSLLLHWGCFGISTLIDPTFDNVQGYYFFKILFFLMLYMKPFVLSEKLLACVKDFQSKSYAASIFLTDPLKSERASMSKMSATNQFTENRRERAKVQDVNGNNTMSPARSPAFRIEDAMVHDPRHALTPSTPGGSYVPDEMDPTQPQMPVAFNDLIFAPTNKLVFNGPFDESTLTYYMCICSKATRNIAFAIKSNAIPRVTAIPPYGILKPGEKQIIAVSIQKFNYENEKAIADKDRIAFDYVFCGLEVTKFSHKLFQGHEMRRRKNIKIMYNP